MAKTRRAKWLEKAAEFMPTTYLRQFVRPTFQLMTRAEFAAQPDGDASAVVGGNIEPVYRRVGECVCVTCGKCSLWYSSKSSRLAGMHCGHFIGSGGKLKAQRNSLALEEDNVAPQCGQCNGFGNGMPAEFTAWMLHARGQDVIDRLMALKIAERKFTIIELVDLRLWFDDRLKVAKDTIAVVRNGGRVS